MATAHTAACSWPPAETFLQNWRSQTHFKKYIIAKLISQRRFWILADAALRRKISFEVPGEHTRWIEGTILEFKELSSLFTTCTFLAFQFKSFLYSCFLYSRYKKYMAITDVQVLSRWLMRRHHYNLVWTKNNIKRKTQVSERLILLIDLVLRRVRLCNKIVPIHRGGWIHT